MVTRVTWVGGWTASHNIRCVRVASSLASNSHGAPCDRWLRPKPSPRHPAGVGPKRWAVSAEAATHTHICMEVVSSPLLLRSLSSDSCVVAHKHTHTEILVHEEERGGEVQAASECTQTNTEDIGSESG